MAQSISRRHQPGIVQTLLALVAFASVGVLPAGTSHAASSPTITRVQNAHVIRVGVATAVPWLGKNPHNNQYFGPAVRIAKTVAKDLHVRLQYVPETFDTIIAALQANQIELADAPLYATPARLKVVDMVPWTSGGFCYLVKKSNTKINKLSDMNDPSVKMGNFIGTGTYEATSHKYSKATQVPRTAAAGEEAPIPDLLSGKVDVAPFDASLALVYKQEYPQLKVLPKDCTLHPDISTPIAVAFAKGDAGFKSFLKALFKRIQPQLNADIKKYSKPYWMKLGGG